MTRAILTCSPHFIDLALNEMRRHHPALTVLQHISPGKILLQTPGSFDKLTLPWRHRLPIYLHHLFPVHAVMALKSTPEDLSNMRQVVQKFGPWNATFQVRNTVEAGLAYSALDVQHFLNKNQHAHSLDLPKGRIVSILIVQEGLEFRAYLGVSWASQNVSPWSDGQIPVTECVPNRAGFKLLEALHDFAIQLLPGNHALDLGVAPEAWTTLLRRRGLKVTAVAPTPLYPWLLYDREVSYQPMLAEDFLSRCQASYDFIVNDMKLDCQDSASLMVDFVRFLRPDGRAIMTLKLRDRNKPRMMDHAFRILRKAYRIVRVRQLVSNRSEVTLFLRRKT